MIPSMNLDALDIDLGILDDLDEDLEFEEPLDQGLCEDATNFESREESKDSSTSLISPSMVSHDHDFDGSSGRKRAKRDSVMNETHFSSKAKKMKTDTKIKIQKDHGHSFNQYNSTDITIQDIPMSLNKMSTTDSIPIRSGAQFWKDEPSEVYEPYQIDSSQSNIDTERLKTLMPRIQAALFNSFQASNSSDLHKDGFQNREFLSNFTSHQHSKHSLIHQMPITLPLTRNEFFPFAQTHIKDFEPFNILFPNIFKVVTKSSARHTPSTQSTQNPLQNLITNHIGADLELMSKVDDLSFSKTHRIHLGIDQGSIASGVRFIKYINPDNLCSDLKLLLNKINRQKKFLVKQMNQISSWYKSQFKDANKMHEQASKFVYPPMMRFSKHLIHQMVHSRNPLPLKLSVRIKCSEFQAPHTRIIHAILRSREDLHPALRALCEPILVDEPKVLKGETSSQIKNTNSNSKSKPLINDVRTIENMKTPSPSSFMDSTPTERLLFIKKLLDERASYFANELSRHNENITVSIQKREKEIQDILSNYENNYMDSITFFNLVKLICDWGENRKDEIVTRLAPLYQPLFPEREIFWGQLPTPTIQYEYNPESKNDFVGQDCLSGNQILSSSLFFRLQSLLVDENLSDEEIEESNSSATWDTDSSDTNDELFSDDLSGDDLIDVSALNLDQKTYLQLREANLIDQPLLPSSQPQVIEIIKKQANLQSYVNTSISAEIRQKQMLVSNLNKSNNHTAEKLLDLALAEATHGNFRKTSSRS